MLILALGEEEAQALEILLCIFLRAVTAVVFDLTAIQIVKEKVLCSNEKRRHSKRAKQLRAICLSFLSNKPDGLLMKMPLLLNLLLLFTLHFYDDSNCKLEYSNNNNNNNNNNLQL